MKPDLWKLIDFKAFFRENSCSGFSLVEIIVAIVITGIVSTSIVAFSTSEMVRFQSPMVMIQDLLQLRTDAETALSEYDALPLADKSTFDPTVYGTYNNEDSDNAHVINDVDSNLTFKKVVLEDPENNFDIILLFPNI